MLDRTAEALLERETLDEHEIARLTEGMDRQTRTRPSRLGAGIRLKAIDA